MNNDYPLHRRWLARTPCAVMFGQNAGRPASNSSDQWPIRQACPIVGTISCCAPARQQQNGDEPPVRPRARRLENGTHPRSFPVNRAQTLHFPSPFSYKLLRKTFQLSRLLKALCLKAKQRRLEWFEAGILAASNEWWPPSCPKKNNPAGALADVFGSEHGSRPKAPAKNLRRRSSFWFHPLD